MLIDYAHIFLVISFVAIWMLILQFAIVRLPRATETKRHEF